MLNYSKLTDAAKKRGLSLAFLSSQIGIISPAQLLITADKRKAALSPELRAVGPLFR